PPPGSPPSRCSPSSTTRSASTDCTTDRQETTMYLGTYELDGDPDDLTERYDRLVEAFPPDLILLNVCIRRPDGITIIDTCPSEGAFRAFSTSQEFAAGLASVGLPTPRVTPVGPVHALHGTRAA